MNGKRTNAAVHQLAHDLMKLKEHHDIGKRPPNANEAVEAHQDMANNEEGFRCAFGSGKTISDCEDCCRKKLGAGLLVSYLPEGAIVTPDVEVRADSGDSGSGTGGNTPGGGGRSGGTGGGNGGRGPGRPGGGGTWDPGRLDGGFILGGIVQPNGRNRWKWTKCSRISFAG